jgi:septum formation protein
MLAHTHSLPQLVLGSGSPYRKALLSRLGFAFDVLSPDVDESPLAGELPLAMSQRLAKVKAHAVVQRIRASPPWQATDVVVIGSDQVAELNGQALGKPGTHDKAVAQLQAMRGQVVHFHTSLTVIRPHTQFEAHATSTSVVTVRDLSDAHIETYLRLERPYDCAGSAKAESLGICLLDRIASDDPTALIGLPLIATARLLRQAGLDPLAKA